MAAIVIAGRKADRQVSEMLATGVGQKSAVLVPRFEMRQFNSQHRGLQRIQSAVERQVDMVVLRALPIVAYGPDAGGDVRRFVTSIPASPAAPRFFAG